jgi:N-methylhydantoinase B
VLRTRLDEIVHNMEWLLFHSGYSPILRESYDGSACLLDSNGRVVGAAGMPMHMYPYDYHVRAIVDRYGDDLRPDDSYLINDPFAAGAFHLPDVAVITPVFYEGRLVAFTASISHKPDIGGLVPGSSGAAARETLHEGLLLPGVRVWTANGLNEDVDAIVRANSRTPEELMGDIRAQIGCTRVGADRLRSLCDEYGVDLVEASFDLLVDRAERLMREELASMPDGVAEAEWHLDSDAADPDTPVKLRVRVEKRGTHVDIDYSGSAPQTKGPVNIRPQSCEAAGVLALVGFLNPSLPVNEGLKRLVTFKNPEGQVTHAVRPAPVNNYFPTMQLLYGLVMKCLSDIDPSRAVAPGGQGTGALTMGFPEARTGRSAVYYELMVSSLGGHPNGDGTTLVLAFCHISTTQPIEIVETEYPVMVLRFEPVIDSAGAGRHRGGPAFVREYRALADYRMGLRSGGYKFGAWGVQGGQGPAKASCTINAGTDREEEMPALFARELEKGDTVRVVFAGGGGLGNPHTRVAEDVLADVRNGIVSVAAAREVYGVAVREDLGGIDEEATAALRAGQ